MAETLPDAATGRVLVFEFPLPANRGNARFGHFYAQHRSKKRYWARLDALAIVGRLLRPPRAPFARASAEITLRTYRAMDMDNAHARLKDVLDYLRSRGYIDDDNPQALTYTLTLATARLADCGITVRLTEVAGDD